MRRREFIGRAAAAGATLALAGAAAPGQARLRPDRQHRATHGRTELADGWRFTRSDPADAADPGFDDGGWEAAVLPHTARIEAAVTGPPGSASYQWQGACWYRRRLTVQPGDAHRVVYLKFDGAMNVADAWLDGRHLGRHRGGYLPFGFDITPWIQPGREHVLSVRLDNRDDPVTGPKPLAQLDFNMWHGLYRGVHLLVKDALHITDPVLAERTAGGGVFVRTERIDAASATLHLEVHVRNGDVRSRRFRVRHTLLAPDGSVAAEVVAGAHELAAGGEIQLAARLEVPRPALWSPRAPNLHLLRTELHDGDRVVDAEETRVGIRRLAIDAAGFRINGERLFLRGTNRHQEHPYIGYALSDAAQYRDARRIKEAGFDYVRLSHYPHSPAFMDACDELGLVVMDCIPGWQYFNEADPEFTELQYENCRRLLRRDRNHPCVVLWEVSLNETAMPPAFIARTHAIAHEEYPGDQCWTCGWTEGYDVFIQARQHGGCRGVTDRPCVVSEYGDWEYYAQNAGLQQEAWADLAPDAANSRQLRWHGERALLQQAANFQEAHNDNRQTRAFADGLWVMFDYNRGYAPDIESSGCMDLFRLPKPSWWFFRSQRAAGEQLASADSGPMVFIASDWTEESPPDVRVFSNCEEVALLLDGRLLRRQRPDRDRTSTHLARPPFTFALERFIPGALEAVGYIDGREAARHAVRTPGGPRGLVVSIDERGRSFAERGKDAVFVHAALVDANGTTVSPAWENVAFGVTGAAQLVGHNPFPAEAGIASILLQAEHARPGAAVYALTIVPEGDASRILAGAVSAGGEVAPMQIRYTTDGSAPGTHAAVYAGPLARARRVRAALFAGSELVATLDTETPKFRLPGSIAPEQRPEPHGGA